MRFCAAPKVARTSAIAETALSIAVMSAEIGVKVPLKTESK